MSEVAKSKPKPGGDLLAKAMRRAYKDTRSVKTPDKAGKEKPRS